MSTLDTLSRHTLIISHLRRAPATFKEISRMLERESNLNGYKLNISIRTFQRDCRDISSLYNIDIQYQPSIKAYSINFDHHSGISERMLEAFDTINAFKLESSLTDFIQFDTRKPKGTEHLHELIKAIKARQIISFLYESFERPGRFVVELEPFALKEFKGRWYLIGREVKSGNIKTYGLDRIEEITITPLKFQYPVDFNLKEYFKHSFGIFIIQDHFPMEVLLSFDTQTAKYILTMPLHPSQEVVQESEDEVLISLKLYLTPDFLSEILSYGEKVKVLKPQSLIDQVKNSLKNSFSNYNDIY